MDLKIYVVQNGIVYTLSLRKCKFDATQAEPKQKVKKGKNNVKYGKTI